MLVLAMIPVFVATRTTGSLQAVLGQLVLIAHLVLCLTVHPFEDSTDNLLQIVSTVGEPPPTTGFSVSVLTGALALFWLSWLENFYRRFDTDHRQRNVQ